MYAPIRDRKSSGARELPQTAVVGGEGRLSSVQEDRMGWGELSSSPRHRPILAKDLARFRGKQSTMARNAGVLLVAAVVCLVAFSGQLHMQASAHVKQGLAASRPPSPAPKFEFTLPPNVRPGSILHVLVPGRGSLAQEVLVPANAVPGDTLSIDMPKKKPALLKELPRKQKLDESEVEEVENEVEHVAEEVAVTVEYTAQQFWLLTFLISVGLYLIFAAIHGVFHGFGPLEVDPRRVVDHPCRTHNKHVAQMVAEAMQLRESGEITSPMPTPRQTSNATPQESPRRPTEANTADKRATAKAAAPPVEKRDKKVVVAAAGANLVRRGDETEGAITMLKSEGQGLIRVSSGGGSVPRSTPRMLASFTEEVEWEFSTPEVLEDVAQRMRTLVPMLFFQ
ncbi:hypothetical protein T484DRAFT_1902758, partial [Baffinella frigidus]